MAAFEIPRLFDPDEMVQWFIENHPNPTADDVEEAGGVLGRNSYPALVLQLHVELGLAPIVLAHCVPSAWQDCEFPTLTLDEDSWEWLFGDAGFTINGVKAPRPTAPIRMFRGAVAEHARGWSWTEDRDLAQWFADRPHNDGRGRLYSAAVPPGALFACMTGDWADGRAGEGQWVVDGRDLAVQQS